MALSEHCSPRCTCETVQITSNCNFSGKTETALAGGEDNGDDDSVTKVAALHDCLQIAMHDYQLFACYLSAVIHDYEHR